MKRFTAVLATLILMSLAITPHVAVSSQPQKRSNSRYVEGQIIVKLKTESIQSARGEQVTDGARLAESVLPEGGLAAESLESIDSGAASLFVVHLANDMSVEKAVEQAANDPRVLYAEPNYRVYPQVTPDDARFDEMWGLSNSGASSGKPGADIGATGAWDLTTGSDDVVVAMIDTGIDLTHPDLAPNVWVNPREIAGNGVDDDSNGLIDDVNGWNYFSNNNVLFDNGTVDFHGTHVAGTIGAVGNNGFGVTGVAWHVKVMALKFIGPVDGSAADAVKSINYAIEQKRRGVNVRAINASWGDAENSTALRRAIIDAGAAGIVFVCAAGNQRINTDITPFYPASLSTELSSVISVAALARDDSLASFSNFGHTGITVAAPGVSILSLAPGGGYFYSDGTSMSTPHVTGIVALLASNNPSLTPAQIKDRIVRTAVPVLSVASRVTASGRANAFNALTDRTVLAPGLAISTVQTNKKFVFVDGLNFVKELSVIEVNGVQVKKSKPDETYEIGNGTVTRLSAKIKKGGIQSTFPQGVPVSVRVVNPATGERSSAFSYTRF